MQKNTGLSTDKTTLISLLDYELIWYSWSRFTWRNRKLHHLLQNKVIKGIFSNKQFFYIVKYILSLLLGTMVHLDFIFTSCRLSCATKLDKAQRLFWKFFNKKWTFSCGAHHPRSTFFITAIWHQWISDHLFLFQIFLFI